MTVKRSAAQANAALNAQTALLNSGFIDIYSGTRPASVATAIGSQVKLGRLTFGATAFAAAASGVATANAIAADSSADAAGLASFARILTSGGTAAYDVDCGESGSGAELILDESTIVASAAISATSLTFTEPLA